MINIILAIATSLLVAILATPALIKVAYLKRLVDEPGEERKLHFRRIPTIGGIIIFAGTLFSYLMRYPFSEMADIGQMGRALKDFQYIGATMIILFFIGIKDDIIGTAPVKKLVGHLLVAFILVIMGDIRITSMHGIFGIEQIPEWASIFLSIVTYTVIVNAINLIDGVDGLAGGIGVIAAISMGIWFQLAGAIEHAVLAFALAGSLLGFLVYNFSPAKIFMGDSGSLTIGLILSILAIKLIEYPVEQLPNELLGVSRPVFAMAALVYPLTDTLRIFVYRIVRGMSPFAADRNHIHHRLLEMGYGHRRTVLLVYATSIFMILLSTSIRQEPSAVFIIMVVVSLLFSQIPGLITYIKRKRTSPAS
ncbi:MAG: undecaprenyl/decaprenyl-phosphate alpha-N-acetylglucosaminyl 1-phosphate transferase [Flavobacteriales bacterium]|nr:undecaprenyl/decaprenyl-phosphate alpha-N-acetylglucosaminyl 1-phosphate transferase [Flavobacteriales bacterium]